MALLSIVVPVYNVSKYLRDGLDSLLNQSVEDVEIICVDDCSTDDSLQVLSEYADQNERVRIVKHDVNRGLSAARNTGMKIAEGEFVAFFDPDDKVTKGMYETLIYVSKEYGVDVVQCGFQTYPNGEYIYTGFPKMKALSPSVYISDHEFVHSSCDMCFSWRFVAKRSFIVDNGLLFNEMIRFCEDAPFNFRMIMSARKIIYVPECLYYYRVNNMNSAMKKKYNPWMESSLQLQIADKKKVVEDFDVDKYTPFTKYMNEDIVKRYTMMMFHNLRPEDKRAGVRRILNMPMVRDAFDFVGYRNIYPSLKEYCFFLMMKWRMYRIVEKYV